MNPYAYATIAAEPWQIVNVMHYCRDIELVNVEVVGRVALSDACVFDTGGEPVAFLPHPAARIVEVLDIDGEWVTCRMWTHIHPSRIDVCNPPGSYHPNDERNTACAA